MSNTNFAAMTTFLCKQDHYVQNLLVKHFVDLLTSDRNNDAYASSYYPLKYI